MTFRMLALSGALAVAFTGSAAAHKQAIDLLDFDQQSGYGPWSGVIADTHGTIFGANPDGGSGSCVRT